MNHYRILIVGAGLAGLTLARALDEAGLAPGLPRAGGGGRGQRAAPDRLHIYVNEDGTEATVVQVHPHPDSMLFHMQVAREHIGEAYQAILEETQRIDVYGKPSDTVLETIGQLAGSGAPLRVKAHHLGGFTRSIAG